MNLEGLENASSEDPLDVGGREYTMSDLIRLLEQCQRDTAEILGSGAAGRLSRWQQYEHDQNRLVQFIKERLRSERRANGYMLEQKKKLSLERIVVHHCPELFNSEDIEIVQATLSGI